MNQNNNIFSLNSKIFVITGGLGQLGQVFVETVIKHGGKAIIFDIFNKDCCDQVSADNKEYIYANKSPAK